MRGWIAALVLGCASPSQPRPAGLGFSGARKAARTIDEACAQLARAAQRQELSKTPRFAPSLEVWQRVLRKVRITTGYSAELSIVQVDSKGQTFPFPAVTCFDVPPVRVYVTASMAERLQNRSLPQLAFLFAHELAHRLNDIADRPDGGFELRPRVGSLDRERLADHRAAFFMAAAGYSTRALFQNPAFMERILDEVPKPEQVSAQRWEVLRRQRIQNLKSVFSNLEMIEATYQAGLSLMFLQEAKLASQLMEWVDRQLLVPQADGRGRLPVPEVRFARALVAIHGASSDAPWQKDRRDTTIGRCFVLFPEHTALWEANLGPRLMGASQDATSIAVRRLENALAWIDSAESLGITSLVSASARACALMYLRRYEEAHAQLERLASLSASRPHLTASLAQNRRLLAHLRGGEVARVSEASAPPRCEAPITKGPPVMKVAMPERAGECPKEYEFLGRLPSASLSSFGVKVCKKGRSRWVDINLPSVESPIRRTMWFHSFNEAERRGLAAWSCACSVDPGMSAFSKRGISSTGSNVYLGVCPLRGGAPVVSLLYAKELKVERLVLSERR